MDLEAAPYVTIDEGVTITTDQWEEQDKHFGGGTATEGVDGAEGDGGLDGDGCPQNNPLELEVRPVSISVAVRLRGCWPGCCCGDWRGIDRMPTFAPMSKT